MTKHTPAPWKASHNGAFVGYTQTGDAPQVWTVIAEVTDGNAYGELNTNSERRKANARLIAAAPELLEALIASIPALEYQCALYGEAVAPRATLVNALEAIEKVTS